MTQLCILLYYIPSPQFLCPNGIYRSDSPAPFRPLLFPLELAGEAISMAFVYINGYPGVGKLTVAKEITHVPRHLWPPSVFD